MVSNKEDIVISGIGGVFPKAINIGEFKDRLFNNESLLETKWPTENGMPNQLGCVNTNYFDNSFFGIHQLQASYMQPVQKLVLERVFEALIDAGVNPTSVRGKKIGCFIGMSVGETDTITLDYIVNGYGVVGHARAMLSNRISYWLNLKGPSVTYDSNWTTGFDVINLANTAMKNGKCDAAIVGACNAAIFEEFQQIYNEMGLLSPDCKTKAFDANANGYGRADGCVVMFLQKASDSKRSYGSIVHVATKFDGCSADHLTGINENTLVNFMEEFYKDCPVKPEEIDYVETYGCALKEIDKAELNALEKVYCKQRKLPLMIGSVKPHTGHAESCESLISLVKVLIAMETSTIPATLSYETPNPEIRGLTNGSFEVVTTNKTWTSEYAAVNTLGVSNSFGHIVVKRNPKNKMLVTGDSPILLPLSSRTENGITKILYNLKHKPSDPEYYNLIQNFFANNIPFHMYRGYAITGSEFIQEHMYISDMNRPIWFVYSGMGSQWCGMANDLMKIPVFAESIRKSHETLSKKGVDLIDIITSSDKTIFDNILNCFIGIASIQIALTDVLTAIGIVPDKLIGHSVGELGCAYADGCITAEQMILAAYYRGRASLEVELEKGMMAAVGLSYSQIKNQLPKNIEVACHNSSESCTLSGPAEDMNKYVKELKDQNIFAKLVNVANIAYHSKYIKPAAPVLLKYLKEVFPEPMLRTSKWISTSNPVAHWNTDLAKYSSAEYHTNNLLSAVLFEEGCQHVPKDAILIEIAPHGLLQAILKRALKNATSIPLTNRNSDNGHQFFLQSLGKLHLAGVNFNVSNLYQEIEYPVSRGTPTTSDLVNWNHTESGSYRTKLDDESSKFIQTYKIDLDDRQYQKYVGHKIRNDVILPVSLYLDIICQLLKPNGEFVFQNLEFRNHLIIPHKSIVPLHVTVFIGSGEFEFRSNNTILLNGKILFSEPNESDMATTPSVQMSKENLELNEDQFYGELTYRGYHLSEEFKLIKTFSMNEKESVAIVNWRDRRWTELLDAMLQQQYLTDGEKYQDARVVRWIQKLVVDPKNLEKGMEARLDYNYFAKMISTKGIQLFDTKTTSYKNEKNDVALYSNDLIPLKGMQFNKLEAGIEFAINITLANSINTDVNKIFISVMLPVDNLFLESLERVIQERPFIQINMSKHTDAKSIFVQQVYPQLLISNNNTDKEIYNIVSSSNAFLLSSFNVTATLFDGITEVAQYFMKEESFSLWKKTSNAEICVVPVKENSVCLQDLESPPAKWVTELHKTIVNNRNKDVYLEVPVIPQEGYRTFTETVRRKPGMKGVRVIFNLDNSSEIDLRTVYKTGLYSSILKRGISYMYVSLPVKYKDNILSDNKAIKIDDKYIEYLSPNLKDETVVKSYSKNIEIGLFDYSGTSSTGKRIMGIANVNKTNGQLQFNPTFSWEVPELWSLQEAASVPYAYVSAYYLMVIKVGLQPGMSILINCACSPIGLAAIAIGVQYHCSVYCTVYTKHQELFLRAFGVPKDRIFYLNNISLKTDIKLATTGVGADLVLNCLSGDLLRNSLHCCADYGHMIHYGTHDVDNGSYILMEPFMRSISFHAFNVGNILFESDEIKQTLWKLVAAGIAGDAVVPLAKKCVDKTALPSFLRKMREGTNVGKTLLKVKDCFSLTTLDTGKITDSKHCYLIYGGAVEIWSKVAEWLVHHGAKKVLISSNSKPEQNINRRLSLLHTYFQANIVVNSNMELSPLELLSECQQFGEIHGVFVLSKKTKNEQEINLLDQALRRVSPSALFVNFVNSASGLCRVRADSGLPTRHVDITDEEDFNAVLDVLNDILTSNCDHITLAKVTKKQTSIIDVDKLLPTIDDILGARTEILSSDADFVQIKTEGPTEIRELAPIFVIAGPMSEVKIKEMANQLLYPTYYALIPSTSWSLNDLAEIYSKKMQEIYPKNVYNLVSVSTGSILLAEIARKLKESKPEATLNIFFIDNAPNYVQEVLMQLGESIDDIETNTLRFICKINDAKVCGKLRAAPNWNERIKYATEHLGLTEKPLHLLEKGLRQLTHLIKCIRDYKPDNCEHSGKIHLIRPDNVNQEENCGLPLYFKEAAKIKLIKTDHRNITSHPDTIDYINFYADV